MVFIKKFVLYLIIIINLGLKINSGCCCCCKWNQQPKNTKKEIKFTITENYIEFNGSKFIRVENVINGKGIVNNIKYESYVFKANNKGLANSIFDKKTVITPNFDNTHFGNISGEKYILAAVETNDNFYIIYCDKADENSKTDSFFEDIKDLKRIRILKSGKITDCRYMFSGCSAEYIDLGGLDASEVTNMKSMFQECGNLKTINLSNLNIQKVSDVSYMFSECSNLESVILKNLNANELMFKRMMFKSCINLKSVDFSNSKIPKIKSMCRLFQGLTNLKSVNLNNLKIPNIDNMASMFDGCSNLESINLIGFEIRKDETKVNVNNIFKNCQCLKTVYLDKNENKLIFDKLNEYYNVIYDGNNKICHLSQKNVS